MKVSIVTAYYNRKPQFYETLKSIKRTEHNDYEVIVADDCSSDEHRLESLVEEFPFLKIIRLERKDKWYINPCVPFNRAIYAATGDILILQNPECLHVHDIISFSTKNINDSNYISFATYGLDDKLSKELIDHNKNNTVAEFYNKLPQTTYNGDYTIGYYNHSRFRPTFYHFCSAITKNNMNKLNGFDERYAKGVGFDDIELLHRIRLLGLKISLIDSLAVIHQFHNYVCHVVNNAAELQQLNRNILNSKTRSELKYRAN